MADVSDLIHNIREFATKLEGVTDVTTLAATLGLTVNKTTSKVEKEKGY